MKKPLRLEAIQLVLEKHPNRDRAVALDLLAGLLQLLSKFDSGKTSKQAEGSKASRTFLYEQTMDSHQKVRNN